MHIGIYLFSTYLYNACIMYDAVVESFKWDAVQAFVDLDKLEALSSPEFRSGACRCYVVNVWEKNNLYPPFRK